MSISRRTALGILGAGFAALGIPRSTLASGIPAEAAAAAPNPLTGAPRVLRLGT